MLSLQDGFAASKLEDISINSRGVIAGIYANGQQIEQAQVVLATFTNLAGLKTMGEGIMLMTDQAGNRTVGTPGQSGTVLGEIIGRSLEMSNVDIGLEFANLIRTQRNFQATQSRKLQ